MYNDCKIIDDTICLADLDKAIDFQKVRRLIEIKKDMSYAFLREALQL